MYNIYIYPNSHLLINNTANIPNGLVILGSELQVVIDSELTSKTVSLVLVLCVCV